MFYRGRMACQMQLSEHAFVQHAPSHTHHAPDTHQAAASAVWMGPEASKGLWQVYTPLVQDLLTRSVRLDRWHPLQADPRCRRTCDRYSAAQSVQRAHEHNGPSVVSASTHS